MSKCYHEEKGTDVNGLHNRRPDPSCTCEGEGGSERGAGRGPKTDPNLTEKGSGAFDHPQTPPAKGPAADPELMAKSQPPLKHPQTPEPTGPAK